MTFAIVLAVPALTSGQNLVPNPSFEILDSCPSNITEIQLAPPWQTFRGSVDLYNRCDTIGIIDVPSNYFGYQEPYDGDGYAGLYSFLAADSLHREIMGAELISPLTYGVPVYISFRLAIGGWSVSAFSSNLSASGVGVYFSTQPWVQINAVDPLPNWTAVHCSSAPTDSLAWVLVSGVFVPDSEYTHIMVGNPLANSTIEVVHIDSTYMTPGGAYVFIDEVCVSEISSDCPLALGQAAHRSLQGLNLYPNPCTERLVIELAVGRGIPNHYDIYDLRGVLVYTGSLTLQGTCAVVDTRHWPVGVFSLVARAGIDEISRAVVVHLNN